MLFNSVEFLFQFLPLVLVGYYALSALGRRWEVSWLVLASLYFYAAWRPEYLWVILVSILLNFMLGRRLARSTGGLRRRRAILAAGIAANLAALAYYKYTTFALKNVSLLLSSEIGIPDIVLPLAISFFTFQQIAYLCDAYEGKCREYDFPSYCLFVTFFPQLIAGPIVHHSEMLPQFKEPSVLRASVDRFVVGLTILGIGLFKKVVVADGFAPYATGVFAVADTGGDVSSVQAWGAALAYTLQLYFDFSGYSDMAVGAARLFGIRLPLNFFSPYKSGNAIEFWRRWHVTLSRFLRDYLYIPLGGNRRGRTRRYVNLLITMVLGGIWHGAGWNFLIWGALHGVYLVINHGWRAYRGKFLPGKVTSGVAYGFVSWLVTFVAVVVGWVFFRAETLGGALRILESMFFGAGADNAAAPVFDAGVWVALGLVLLGTLTLPNAYELLRNADPVLNLPEDRSSQHSVKLTWKPSMGWALVFGAATAIAVLHLGRVSEFLYFQF